MYQGRERSLGVFRQKASQVYLGPCDRYNKKDRMPITRASTLKYVSGVKDEEDIAGDHSVQKPRAIRVPVSGIILIVLVIYLSFVVNRNYLK